MKKLLLLIFAILVLGAACAPAVSEPVVPATPEPPAFTDEELEVIRFIEGGSQEIEKAHDLVYDAVDAGSEGDFESMSNDMLEAAEILDDVNKEWADIEWTNGETDRLETTFNRWLRAEKKYVLAVGRIVYANAPYQKALRLQEIAETRAEICKECLEDVQETLSTST